MLWFSRCSAGHGWNIFWITGKDVLPLWYGGLWKSFTKVTSPLSSCAAIRAGSTPTARTNKKRTSIRCVQLRKHSKAREKRYSFGYAISFIFACYQILWPFSKSRYLCSRYQPLACDWFCYGDRSLREWRSSQWTHAGYGGVSSGISVYWRTTDRNLSTLALLPSASSISSRSIAACVCKLRSFRFRWFDLHYLLFQVRIIPAQNEAEAISILLIASAFSAYPFARIFALSHCAYRITITPYACFTEERNAAE